MPSSPEAAIGHWRLRKRSARRQAVGLAALTAVGLLLVTLPPAERFGALLAGFATALGVMQVAVIASARHRVRRAVDHLIDAGFVVRADTDVGRLVDARMGELGDEASRRGMAKTLRHALVDAARPRSSNPLVLADRSIVLRRGAALALLVERDRVLRIARELTEHPANPRAILALHSLLYPQATGPRSVDDQQQQAQRQLRRIADLLELVDRQATFAGFRRLQPVALLCPRSRRYNQVSALPASLHCSGFARRRHQQRCLTTH